MTPEDRAAGTSPVDLDGWSEVLPDDDDAEDALGWPHVRGLLWVVGAAVVAFATPFVVGWLT